MTTTYAADLFGELEQGQFDEDVTSPEPDEPLDDIEDSDDPSADALTIANVANTSVWLTIFWSPWPIGERICGCASYWEVFPKWPIPVFRPPELLGRMSNVRWHTNC